MTTVITWQEIAWRLAWTLLAGALIGLNRGGHDRPAGLRTTMLVCLAASLSMIDANLLLATAGKPGNSFVVLDLMRLPLGILSGMGFIGAGAILHRKDFVQGVTTAATLWYVTMLGICFGGGQTGLGAAGLVAAIIILWVLKALEDRWLVNHHGRLKVVCTGLPAAEIQNVIDRSGYRFSSWIQAQVSDEGRCQEMVAKIRWKGEKDKGLPPFLDELSRRTEVERVEWDFEML